MGTFTEANWQSRRIKLSEQIVAARAAYLTAAALAELEDGPAAAVTSTKAELDQLEVRLTGLDAAWAAKKAEIVAERDEAERAGRASALTKSQELLAERAMAGAEVEDATRALGAAWARFRTAGEQIGKTVAPHHVVVDVREVIAAANGPLMSPAGLIVGLLLECGGLDLTDMDARQARWKLQELSIEDMIQRSTGVLSRLLSGLADDGEES